MRWLVNGVLWTVRVTEILDDVRILALANELLQPESFDLSNERGSARGFLDSKLRLHYGNQSRGYLMRGDHYDHPLWPGLQPDPPSQTPGVLSQRYWRVSVVTWPQKSGFSEVGSSGPSSLMYQTEWIFPTQLVCNLAVTQGKLPPYS